MTEYIAGEPESETPVNPYSLLEAVNRSSDMAHTGWLIFLLVMAYLMIAVAGVTHTDLLLEKPVQLPIFGIEIPQIQFFQFAPILLVLFHLGIVSQLVLLARKTLEFDLAVQQLESSVRRTHPLRLELHNFFFVQGIGGPHRSIVMGAFLHGMSWLTLVVIPVLLLLFIQIKFLPYHDVVVTWSHRIALVVDIFMMTLLGVFLIRPETSFWRAVWRSVANYPVGFLMTVAVFFSVAIFSFFVATIPGEPLDRMVQKARQGAASGVAASTEQPDFMVGFAVPAFVAGADGSLFGVFHRNLIVTDQDLVEDREVTAGEPTISLRDRDLRFAKLDRSDLHQADLTGANLDGASLVGTDLRAVRLQCADITLLILTDDRKASRCASARNADFTRAVLTNAQMAGADVRGARFEEATLNNSNMSYSLFAGTNFSSAKLQKVDFTGGTRGQGANFLIASLEGADLTGSQLQFADFSSANMQGAVLAHAHLQSAVLRDANLEGADLQRTKLHGADLTSAAVSAADIRWAQVWMTSPPADTAVQDADLSETVAQPLDQGAITTLRATLRAIEDDRLRELVRESLSPLLDQIQSDKWRGSEAQRAWVRLVGQQTYSVGDTLYRETLTRRLSEIACRPRWVDGSVATGILRRAKTPNFRGDLQSIIAAIQSESCTPRSGVAPSIIKEALLAADSDS